MSQEHIAGLIKKEYAAGFITDIESDTLPPGLNEEVIAFISARKNEPQWLLEWRLKAYHAWLGMTEPEWAHVHYPKIDYQGLSYFSAPKSMADRPKSLDEVDPELLRTYEKLGIPLHERAVPPSGTSCWKPGSFSVPFPRRSTNTRSWCKNTWAAWCRSVTITSRP